MWQKIKNSDFKNFNIENLTASIGDVEFYAPYETIRELKKVIDSFRLSDEEKLQFLSGISTTKNARENLLGATHALQTLATTLIEQAMIGNSNRFVLPKYSAKLMDSSDLSSLDDGVKFEEKGYKLNNIDLKHDEYVVCYDKKNFLGDFEGYIFTNYRILSVGMQESFVLDWSELKSIKKKSFLPGCILNGSYDTKMHGVMVDIAESMLDYDFIANALIERINGIVNKFSRLSYDRYTYSEYKALIESIEEAQKEKIKSKLYLYVENDDISIPIIDDKKIKVSDLKENSYDTSIIAKIEPHPKKQNAHIIRNLSDESWEYVVSKKRYTIEPKQARALISDGVLRIYGIKIEVKKGNSL